MKAKIATLLICLLAGGLPLVAGAACNAIQGGGILDSDGNVVTVGFDQWGYNYQAELFNGGYCDAYRGASWCQAYADVNLLMKWNDPWLSNMDCDGDSLLDRHFGHPSYIDSGAWLTNEQSGKVDVNGKLKQWTYFVKIVAISSGDTISGGKVYSSVGKEIGQSIWGEFAIVQEIYNDPSAGAHGILYKSPSGPGLGNLTQ